MNFIGLASEGILAIFEKVALNLGKSYLLPRPINRAGRPYGKAPYYLASFQKEFSAKSLPLGYRWPSSRPQAVLDCDSEACSHPSGSAIQRLSCGHTFHPPCMSDEHGNSLGCTICLPHLISDIQKLCHSWNIGLLSGGGETEDEDSDNDDNDGGDENSTPEVPKLDKDDKYFKSTLFCRYISDKLGRIKSAILSKSVIHEE